MSSLKCNGKMWRPKKRHKRRVKNAPCTRPVAWLIGTAKVPYCETCAAEYPKRAGSTIIHREKSP